MQADFQITLTIILGTLLFLFLAGLIVFSALLYRRAQHRHQDEMVSTEARYKEEMLMTQLEIREKTLEHVSQEIHDNIGQSLSLAKIYLSRLQENIPDEQKQRLDDSKKLVAKSIQDLRTLSHTLNPTFLADKTIPDLLKLEVEKLKNTNLEVEYTQSGDYFMVSPEKRLVIYRMIQEVLQNLIKHAGANGVIIRLEYSLGKMNISIMDDGTGFDIETARSKGSGFYNLYQRSVAIGAEFEVTSSPEGTWTIIQLKE